MLIGPQLLLACLALGLAVRQIGKYTSSLDGGALMHNLGWLLLAAIVYVGFYAVLSVHWQYICRSIDPKTTKYQWLAVFAAQPYKYLPTSIFSLTFRAKYARQLGMNIKKSSLAQLIENVSVLASAVALGGFVAICVLDSSFALGLIFFVCCLILFVVGLDLSLQILRRQHLKIPLRRRVVIFFLSLSGWLVNGVGFYIVAAAFGEHTSLIEAIGANAAAVEAGILAIFAPGGIGVRELVFGLFGIGAVVIIAWRLVTAIVDVVICPISWRVIRKFRQ